VPRSAPPLTGASRPPWSGADQSQAPQFAQRASERCRLAARLGNVKEAARSQHAHELLETGLELAEMVEKPLTGDAREVAVGNGEISHVAHDEAACAT